jgi:hypothetical protein
MSNRYYRTPTGGSHIALHVYGQLHRGQTTGSTRLSQGLRLSKLLSSIIIHCHIPHQKQSEMCTQVSMLCVQTIHDFDLLLQML